MAEKTPLEQIKAAQETAKNFKAVGKHGEDAKKLLAKLNAAQSAAKAAKKELEGESDDDA
jgi:hypothetical protein